VPRIRTLSARIGTLDTRSCAPPPKTAAPIYQTPEYAEWRSTVIDRAHGYCQDPQCKTPNRKPSRLYADHVKELRDRPDLAFDPANGLARCGSCHTRKTAQERAKRM
jgi:5-methylcytosine-specific restriction protein A